MPFVPNRTCDNTRLTQKKDCKMAICWDSDYYDAHDEGEKSEVETEYTLTETRPMTIEIVEKVGEEVCELEPNPGYCKGSTERWFYNTSEGRCLQFQYTGCGGNKNSFSTQDECLDSCHPTRRARAKAMKSLKSLSLVRGDYIQGDQPQPPPPPATSPAPVTPAGCKVTTWTTWSSCSSSCGRGWVTRTRQVTRQPEAGGKGCPTKLVKKRRCKLVPCAAPPPSWYQTNFRMLQGED
jgi:hypothetical protein